MVLFYSIMLFIMGCVFGSFFYVVGTRLPEEKSLIKPGSHCIFCNHKLAFFELIPIFSYLFLRGRCRYCHEKLSKEYILYELLTGILFLLSFAKFGFTYEFFVALIVSSLVVLIFITDFRYMIILDSPLVVSSLFLFILKVVYFSWKTAFMGIVSGFLTFLVMLFVGKIGDIVFKKESLGGGDIKFSFVIGMILGFKYAMVALVFSTFLALPYAVGSLLLKKDNEVPFGPFLVGSVFIVFFFLEKFQYIFYLFYH